jgi:hypothetical protein
VGAGVLERALARLIPVGKISVEPGDIKRHFAPQWNVDQISCNRLGAWPCRSATYLMTRDQ